MIYNMLLTHPVEKDQRPSELTLATVWQNPLHLALPVPF